MFGRPPRLRVRCVGGDIRRGRRDILEQCARVGRRAAAFGKACDPQNADAVKGDGDDVADAHSAAGGIDAGAVEPDQTIVSEPGGGRAGADHPRVPQPFVDPLPIQTVRALLAALL